MQEKEDSSTVFKTGKSHGRSLTGHTQNEDKRWDKSVRRPVQSLSFLLLPIWLPQDCQKMCHKHLHKITHTYYPITYTHTYIHTSHSYTEQFQAFGIPQFSIPSQHIYYHINISHMPFINIKTYRHRIPTCTNSPARISTFTQNHM